MLLKDTFNINFIQDLAAKTACIHPSFPADEFIADVMNDEWESKELKQRMRHVTECLHLHLDLPYEEALPLIIELAGSVGGLPEMIFPDYIEVYGLHDFERSMTALTQITEHFSSEFGIRPYISQNPTRAFELLYQCANSNSYHVRRLASEGCRPLLPWAQRVKGLTDDPAPILPILEKLKADEEKYVRKSVANNLNDISKNQPEFIIKIAKRWAKDENPITNWIIKHGLRTLLKQGHPEALAIIGVQHDIKTELIHTAIEPQAIKIGETATLSITVKNNESAPHPLRLEYAIHYILKTGKTGKKVFQLGLKKAKPGETVSTSKKHSFRQRSTRVHQPGIHKIDFLVNGQVKSTINVDLSS